MVLLVDVGFCHVNLVETLDFGGVGRCGIRLLGVYPVRLKPSHPILTLTLTPC